MGKVYSYRVLNGDIEKALRVFLLRNLVNFSVDDKSIPGNAVYMSTCHTINQVRAFIQGYEACISHVEKALDKRDYHSTFSH